MFERMEDYIKKTREERRSHLDLKEPCVEIGGYDSREYRGLLAHYLKTTIPTTRNGGQKSRYACLCHACHNHGCSNPRHLYWGTYADNNIDQQENGTMPVAKTKVKKERKSKAPRKELVLRSGQPLIEEELEAYREYFLTQDLMVWGWVSKATKELGISHTHVRRLVKKLGLKTFKRK